MDKPKPLAVLFSIAANLMLIKAPESFGEEEVQHPQLDEVLDAIAGEGDPDLTRHDDSLVDYVDAMTTVDPDRLSPGHALAYWINLYNAGALRLAARAQRSSLESVLRVPGAFSADFVTIAGEELSLDGIEHAKIRRFSDPRIHSALVCGSVSCPTLRPEAFRGDDLDEQLEDQMRRFLAGGGAQMAGGVLGLSRVFKWYGSDFVRPHRMPTFIPTSRAKLVKALSPWLDFDVSNVDSVEYQGYDWGLRCSVG